MSAAAKLWPANDGSNGWTWHARHDGVTCQQRHFYDVDCLHTECFPLSEAMKAVEDCMGHAMRWVIEDGVLRGWRA